MNKMMVVAIKSQQQQQQHIPEPDLLGRSTTGGDLQHHHHMQQQQQKQKHYLPCAGNPMATVASRATVLLNIAGATIFSEPGSDLTSTSRKRPRGRGDAIPPFSHVFHHSPPPHANLQHHHHHQQSNPSLLITSATGPAGACEEDSGCRSSMTLTSTSGRLAALSPLGAQADLLSYLNHHAVEIDALIRVQSERLRIVLDEPRKRQRKALLLEAEQVHRRLREKEAEIERVSKRNAELEEKVRQVAAETQVWLGVARNSEDVAAALRTSLEHALLLQNQNLQSAAGAAMREGCGDTDDPAAAAARSSVCCSGTSAKDEEAVRQGRDGGRYNCRVCGCGEVRVLVLPCRHLCLCSDCESKVQVCPVCESAKNASLQILM